MPTMVADYVPDEREVVIHSENGIVGMGPAPTPEQDDPWLINAGRSSAWTLRKGGAYVQSGRTGLSPSFAAAHLDLCVLGAFEVGRERRYRPTGPTGGSDMAPAVGGAMDLSAGGKTDLGGDGAHHQGRTPAPRCAAAATR